MKFIAALALLATLSLSAQVKASEAKMLLENEKNTVGIYKANVRSVVNVTNIRTQGLFLTLKDKKLPRGQALGLFGIRRGILSQIITW